MLPFDLFFLFLAVVVVISTIRIAAQYQRAVVFRLGRYNRTAGPGVYFTIPFLEWRTITDLA